jgi:PST family polysaccharide transporter
MNYPKYLLHRLAGVDIIKVFSLNAIATLVRMLAGMISVKVVAVIIGPAGIALLGQLNNFNSILLGMANGGITTGITKYVAEYKDDDSYLRKFLSNALRITLISSLLVSVFMIFGCVYLSRLILLSDEYYYVFIIFGFTIFLYTLNGLLIAVLNGFKKFKKYVRVNIIGTIFGLLYSVALVSFFGLTGAMINAVTFQSMMFFVTLYMFRNEPWLKREFFRDKLDIPVVKKYLGYSVMTLTSLALFPVSQMLLRGYVISEISASDAGIWEGMNRISAMYLGVITSALTIYYLPRLSEIQDNGELRKEIFKCYRVIVPILICISFLIFILRYFILWLLFTPEFYKMADLFPWQLVGDFFKICSWMLAFLMVAKAQTKNFILTEIVFTSSYFVLSYSFVRVNGIVGLTQGYLLNYIFYTIAMCIMFRNVIKPVSS